MTIQEAKSLIENKMLEIDGKYYHFNYGGKLLITSTDAPVEGFYSIGQLEKRCYIRTDPEIVAGKKELFLDLIIDEKIILVDE